jgi:hypothetical protein
LDIVRAWHSGDKQDAAHLREAVDCAAVVPRVHLVHRVAVHDAADARDGGPPSMAVQAASWGTGRQIESGRRSKSAQAAG